MLSRRISFTLITLLAGLLLWAALNPVAKAGMYRWKGADGRTHYSDSLPPSQSGKGYQVIDPRTGAVVRTVKPAKTAAQLAQEQAAKQAEQAKAEARAQRKRQDQVLLSLYSSVDDIKRVRDNQLGEIDRQIQQAESALKRAEKRAAQGSAHDADRLQARQDVRQLKENIADLQQKRQAVAQDFQHKIQRFERIKR